MSDVARLESGNVDAALGRWRHTTVERRSVWDQEHALAMAEMLRRRKTALLSAGFATFFCSLVAGTAVAFFTIPAAPIAAVAIAAPTHGAIGTIGEGPFVDAPRDESTFNAGVTSAVRSWNGPNALWVHFDYTGSPLLLKWTDGANRAVMEPIPCVNRASKNIRRCFVGRSKERVNTAFADENATPGLWTVQACRDARCAPVATYTVTR